MTASEHKKVWDKYIFNSFDKKTQAVLSVQSLLQVYFELNFESSI